MAAEPNDTPLTLEQVKAVWPQVMHDVRLSDKELWTLLTSKVRLSSVKDYAVMFEVDDKHTLARLSKLVRHINFYQVVEKHLGTAVVLDFSVNSSPLRPNAEAKVDQNEPQSVEPPRLPLDGGSRGTLRNQIFISYSRKDKRWLERLQVHLRPLERANTIVRWDDTLIQPGQNWREEIRRAIASAKVAVLLVSADFLASDFIVTNELPPLLAAAEEEGAVILPVILTHCRFQQTLELAKFQAVNDPSVPLSAMRRPRQDEFLVRVTDAVESALKRSIAFPPPSEQNVAPVTPSVNASITPAPSPTNISSAPSGRTHDARELSTIHDTIASLLGVPTTAVTIFTDEEARSGLQNLLSDLERQIAQERATLEQLTHDLLLLEFRAARYGQAVPAEISNNLNDIKARRESKQQEIGVLGQRQADAQQQLDFLNRVRSERGDKG